MEFIKEGMVIVKHSHGLVATIVAASLVATFISPTTSIAYAQPAAPINGAGASATSTTPANPEDNPIGTQGDPNAQPGSPSTEPKAQILRRVIKPVPAVRVTKTRVGASMLDRR